MTAVKPLYFLLFCLLPVATALLNTVFFGPLTLTAYFLYSISGCFAVIAVNIVLWQKKSLSFQPLPRYISLFMLLAAFIYVHGLVTHTIDLDHYYWAASALFLVGVYRVKGDRPPADKSFLWLYKAIAILALLESAAVILQYLGLAPSMNPLFRCTGTWENPNVSAMFVAMAVFACLNALPPSRKQPAGYIVLVIVISSIFLLQCRTAILVSALFIMGQFGSNLSALLSNRFKFNRRGFVFLAAAVFALLGLGLATSVAAS